ncbi:hypothetical protein PHYSODRAFT_332827 [Phytophthora sojae]|uniref:Uncharacterized protein n=1 Tax=Phytophthora sojae (strain P6497) TaxID=1094619 RepID=G4ZQ51_PHYSP|nr:hypothetical protein PHYSODRAFT_332827 [Phytophthora sojae]EGZ14440.1 hypothetical protein PHYSODRAFT_332827 [Phytophthora sojae]|eukprot:XP_009528189.1 hypothetical protein PHYSODRAFT_332827 [Phytophthora sojae]
MSENPPAPLLAVTLVFRSKPKFLGLPHILDHVSTILDTSVELPLWTASNSQIFEDNEPKMPENLWTLRKYIRADNQYRQFQFRLSMGEAVSRKDLEMVKWLSSKFPECKIPSELVVEACEQGAMEILQFFYDNDREVLESKGLHGVGHGVEWGGESMAAAISAHHCLVVAPPHSRRRVRYEGGSGVGSGSGGDDGCPLAGVEWCGVSESNEEGKLEGAVNLLETAAENGHLDIVRWLIENDEAGELTELGGEGRVSILPAAINGHAEVAKFLRDKVQRPTSSLDREQELELQLGTHEALDEQFMLWLYDEYGDDPFVDVFDYGDKFYDRQTSVDTVAMDAAANNGHLDVLKYLHEIETLVYGKRKSEETTKRSPPRALKERWMELLRTDTWMLVRWLSENRSEGCTSAAMDGAAGNGHLEVVQWLHSNTQAGCTTIAMDSAAQNGHLKVVKWLHEHRSEGCTGHAMDKTAEKGFLEVVKEER